MAVISSAPITRADTIDGGRDRDHQQRVEALDVDAADGRHLAVERRERQFAPVRHHERRHAQPEHHHDRPRRLVRTPSTLPNSTASSERPSDRDRAWITSPIANEAVVTTPIAASDPITPRPATRAISNAVTTAPHAGAEEVGGTQRGRHRRAAEHRVRQAVPDVAHRAQHDVDADEAAQCAGEHGDHHAALEEGVGERLERIERDRPGTISAGPAAGRAGRGRPRARPASRRAGARSSARRRCVRARTGGAPRPAGRRRRPCG